MQKSLHEWAKGKFKVENNQFFFEDKPLPASFNERIIAMASSGEDPNPLFLFWEKLQENPSHRSVSQLWDFLKHEGIPLTPAGTFLAYKSVRQDYKDHHSGQFDNSPGRIISMPRNQISDDPNLPCHEGLHVGALAYVESFHHEGRIVVVEVEPKNVVCVPYDSSQHKMRVCEYYVVGNHGGDLMPSTSVDAEFVDVEIEPVSVRKSKGSKWQKLDEMDIDKLMEVPLEKLRKYAAHGLSIVGASRILGGKTVLVMRIVQARSSV